VDTQNFNQKFQDPWLAIVVDPVRTIAQGKVQLGAFRTYPDDHKPADADQTWQSVPLDKVGLVDWLIVIVIVMIVIVFVLNIFQ
jgi:COP9 signalosome complex subunit 5